MLSSALLERFGLIGGRAVGVALAVALAWAALHVRRPLISLLLSLTLSEAERIPNVERILLSVTRWLVWLICFLGVLSLFGADVWQVITGAGIIGVALGLGAQNVVRDMIAGFFIMVENQYSPGDWVEVNGQFEAMVEALDLRMTRLRGWDGAVVYLGNSSILKVKNFNRDGLRALVEVAVPFEADQSRVRAVIDGLCREMAQSYREHYLHHQGQMVEPPHLYGVTDISSARGVGVTYCMMALTRPESYWYVLRETRRLLVERLAAQGIPLSYPQRVFRQP